MKEELVILVDKNDTQIGLMPKMEAHEKGILHRAFSVFVLNDDGALMLQQRALHKYHSPGLWTNTFGGLPCVSWFVLWFLVSWCFLSSWFPRLFWCSCCSWVSPSPLEFLFITGFLCSHNFCAFNRISTFH